MSFRIMGRYRGRSEELDTAETDSEAHRLVAEYRMAFGPDWQVWTELQKEDHLEEHA